MHLKEENDNGDISSWKMILQLWDFSQEMWEHHNSILHDAQLEAFLFKSCTRFQIWDYQIKMTQKLINVVDDGSNKVQTMSVWCAQVLHLPDDKGLEMMKSDKICTAHVLGTCSVLMSSLPFTIYLKKISNENFQKMPFVMQTFSQLNT